MKQKEKDPSQELTDRFRFETMLADISTGFINIPADQVDHAILDSQRRVCECLDLDRSTLWQISKEDRDQVQLTHIYQPPASPQPPDRMQARDHFPWSQQKMLAGEIVVISRLSDFPPEAGRDQETFRFYGTKSTVLIPLSVGGSAILGALSFAATRGERHWSDSLIKRLQLVAQMFANALARKRTEEALRVSETRLSLAAESANVGLWVMETGTGKFWVTAKARELFGFLPDRDLDLERVLDAVHPEDRDRVRRTVEETIQSGKDNSVEYRIMFPDGSTRWILSRGRPYRSSPGDPARLMGVSIDITERKQAEEELQKSEERMLALVENTSDMIWSVDTKTFGLLTFNHALQEYFFRSHGIEIHLGMTPDQMLPPYYAARWSEFYARALREGAFVMEYVTSAKSHTLLLSFNCLKRGGEVFGISVFGKDITERKRAEEALQKSEERFRQIAENVSDFIWEVDANGLFTYASPAVEKILGYTPDELIGKMRFYDLFAPDIREGLKAAALNVFAAKESFRAFPNPNVSKDGKIVHLETSGVPVLDEAGNLVGYRGSDADVTGREKAGEALQQAFSEIKQLKEQLEAENVYLREDVKMVHNFDKIVGQSDALRYVLFRMDQVASTDATVLIQGETGTGKGVVAHAIHGRSPRKDRSLITVNCAALPANLIESELFGREKGAFTGSHARQMGRFEVADKGTIFLDEIGELPLELQAKLLRVIQDGEFERLGSPHTMKVDVRIIVSTSRNLTEEIDKGRFREDLYYRLNVFPITIPPLRQRRDDVPLLVDHFVKKFNRKMGKDIKTLPRETMKALQDYSWPGNIRELEHVIERAMITTQGSVLRLAEKVDSSQAPDLQGGTLSIADVEREHILRVLEKTDWRIEGNKGAASLLDLNPSTLRSRMQKLEISRPDRNSDL